MAEGARGLGQGAGRPFPGAWASLSVAVSARRALSEAAVSIILVQQLLL